VVLINANSWKNHVQQAARPQISEQIRHMPQCSKEDLAQGKIPVNKNVAPHKNKQSNLRKARLGHITE
jgi:hypothetical protein